MPRFLQSTAVAVLCLAAPALASAATISPVNIEMTPTGLHARSEITLTNTSPDPIAVEPSVETTVMNRAGITSHAAADDDFLILPAQVLVPPGSTQVFRVQWLGDPQLAESKSYLITMNQLPIKALSNRAALAVTISLGVAVNVAAASATPELSLIKTAIKKDGMGKAHPLLSIDNPTAAHALLQDAAITLTSDTWSTTLQPGALSTALGPGLVQPHKIRDFVLPVDLPSNTTHLSATIAYQPGTAN